MKKIKVYFSLLVIIFILFSPCMASLRVHFINVGEGDSILIQMPKSKNILVDTGNLSAGYKVEKYLKSKKISQLESIIITHVHPDHVGGIFYILPQIKTKLIYYNGYNPQGYEFFLELENLAKDFSTPMRILKAGDQLFYREIRIEVLSPKSPLSGDMNRDSIVLKIILGKVSFLLTGDLNHSGEKGLIEEGVNLKSDVLKIGHHGAEDSSSEEFINKVNPRVAILSVGKDNRYGYPSSVVIERFKIKDIPIYRTDFDGTIIIQTNGVAISVKKEKQ